MGVGEGSLFAGSKVRETRCEGGGDTERKRLSVWSWRSQKQFSEEMKFLESLK